MSRVSPAIVTVLACLVLACPLAWAASTSDRYHSARHALHDGDVVTALAAFSELHDEYPQDVDYSFGRALALARLGRDAEALEQFDNAVQLAPEYEDVWREKYKLLLRRQDEAGLQTFRARCAEQFPAANWWHEPRHQKQHPWLLTVGAGIDSLSNDLPGWDSEFVELHYKYDERRRYALRVSRDARNSIGDVSTGLGAEFILPSGWIAGIDFSAAGSPTFQPRNSINAYAGRTIGNGWSASLRYRYRDYSSATVSSFAGGVEKYFLDYRIAYELAASRLHGASSFANHVLTANWFYSDESSIGVSLNTGREAESIGAGRVLETDVQGIAINGRRKLTERVGLQWWLGIHDQGDYYRRRFIGLAVSIGI